MEVGPTETVLIVGGLLALGYLWSKHRASGLAHLLTGLGGLAVAWRFRPPGDLLEAIDMAVSGREFVLKESIFQALIVISAVMAITGLVKLLRSGRAKAD